MGSECATVEDDGMAKLWDVRMLDHFILGH
jgi:hypothetical protein